ncbi:hypothetical protein BH09BAC2_BH09BAC2_01200 [soil metagenome]
MRKPVLFILLLIITLNSFAQDEYVQSGEYGITLGAANYFGDLNMNASLSHPKPLVGILFRKQFSNYTALRASVHYAQLGYSDKYSTHEYQHTRNLSFNTDIFEFALQGDFNFFKFNPQDPYHNFTPYLTFGIGVFSYDPYAFYNNEKVMLRPLHTEGQTFYQDRKEYSSMAVCFPIGFGIKYSMSDKMNFSFEITHRFTNTDYLDDVSKTYIGAEKFPLDPNGQPGLAANLQDRSGVYGKPIGIEGRQRGWSKQKDQYIFAEVGFTFNLSSYRCPPAK